MTRSTVIVGHGPSLKGKGLGPKIDQCDVVVRLKNCSMLLAEPHDYGRKTDVMCSSTEVLHHLHKVKAKEYWGYPKKGHFNMAGVWNLSRKVEFAPIHVPLELCNFWNDFFRKMGAQHNNVSTGLAAVIIALDRYKPEKLYLAGFDKVLNPDTEGYKCTVPTAFNGNGTKDTGHDWKKENELLPYLQEFYKAKVIDLVGLNDRTPGRIPEVREEMSGDAK
jgi:hypothetical protein